MFGLIILYGLFALIREFCAVKYYGCVFNGWAGLASILNFTIGTIDCLALVLVFERIASGWGTQKAIIPLLVYEVFGSLGTYLGVKRRATWPR